MGGEERHQRQLVFRLALSLVLGLVTTWAVAWGCALLARVEQPHYPLPSLGRPLRIAWISTGAGKRIVHASVIVREGRVDWVDVPFGEELPRWTEARRRLEAGKGAPRGAVSVDLPDGTAIHTWSEPATGWPTLCLRAVRASWEREYTRGAIVLARGRQHLGVRDFLPHYPIWRGLIANTLFFAVPWYLLLISVPFVRRRWRLCRGQCPSCRYDLRGDLAAGCPECGWGRG